jgi:hypothetical protein
MDELRERLASSVYGSRNWVETRDDADELVDAVLAEIAKTHVIVPAERWRECLQDRCHEWGICEELDDD